jgi:radical SAM-linked protein
MAEMKLSFIYRVAVTKGEALRYISHLDYAGAIQRAIRRAGLPAAYSEGFNPHMKVSFASALAVGVTSDVEYFDLEMTEPLPPLDVAKRLKAALPPGIELLELRRLRKRKGTLMAEADEAGYTVDLPLTGTAEQARTAVAAFNAAAECVFHRATPKKTRDIEVKQYVAEDVALETDGDAARLTMKIRITPTGSVKPGEVLSLLVDRFGFPGDGKAAGLCRRSLTGRGKSLLEIVD